jgi:hypothetical protein
MKRRWFLRVEFRPRELWIGAHWKRGWCGIFSLGRSLDVYVCLLPMLPIHFGYADHYAVVQNLEGLGGWDVIPP